MRQRDWIGVALVLVALGITISGRDWIVLAVEVVLCVALGGALIWSRRRNPL